MINLVTSARVNGVSIIAGALSNKEGLTNENEVRFIQNSKCDV